MTLKIQLLVGMDPSKEVDMWAMLAKFEEEEVSLQGKINKSSRNFLAIVRNQVGQLQPIPAPSKAPVATPTAPPGISTIAQNDGQETQSGKSSNVEMSDDRRSSSIKRRRLLSDDVEETEIASLAIGGLMLVDTPDPQDKEVDKVCIEPPLPKNMLMVTHNDTSASSSLNLLMKPLP